MQTQPATLGRPMPLENALEAARQVYIESTGSGDLVQACQTYYTTQAALADLAPRLADLIGETEHALAFARLYHYGDAVAGFLPFRQFGRALLGLTTVPGCFDDDIFNEAAHLEAISGNASAITYYHVYRALSAAIFGDAACLQQHAADLAGSISAISDYYPATLALFVRALDLVERLCLPGTADCASLQAELNGCVIALKERASQAPADFAQLVALVEAERLAPEDPDKALHAFDVAISAAEAGRRPWHYALACERAARFCARQGYTAVSRNFLRAARQAWFSWGATGKVAHLEDKHGWLRESRSAEPERQAAQDTLSYQNALLEAQKETSLDGITVMSARGDMLSFNQRFIDMWRIPPEVAATGNIDAAAEAMLAQVVDREAFLARVQYLYEHDDEKASDEVLLSDGRVFDRYSAPIMDSAGNSYGRIWFFRDISDRKRAEKALLSSEDRFRSLIEQAPVAIAMSRDARTVWGNADYLRMFGFEDLADLVGRPLVEQISPAQREDVLERLRKFGLHPAKTMEFDTIGLRKDGSQFPFHVAVGVVELADGPAVVGYFNDITERMKAKEDLAAAHQQLTDIIEFLPDATLVIDQDNQVIAWNRAIEDMTGIKKEEMLGRGDYAYAVPLYGSDQPLLINMVNRKAGDVEARYYNIRQEGHTLSAEKFAPALRGGTGAYLWALASPLIDPHGNQRGAIEVMRDITDRVQSEEELQQHRKNLEELVRQRTADLEDARLEALDLMREATQQRQVAEAALADKEVLLREIHHRVKNNLNTVSDLLYLQARTLTDEQARGAFQDSQQQILAMARLHEHLYRSENLARVDMNSYLSRLAADLNGSLARRPVQITTQASGIMLHIDKAVPCGLMVNELVSNALKHAFPGDAKAARVTVHLTAKDGQDVLVVSDNGVGLPEDLDISQVPSLGLRLVGMLVRQLQGRLEVTSAPGQGTTFTITFPYSD